MWERGRSELTRHDSGNSIRIFYREQVLPDRYVQKKVHGIVDDKCRLYHISPSCFLWLIPPWVKNTIKWTILADQKQRFYNYHSVDSGKKYIDH